METVQVGRRKGKTRNEAAETEFDFFVFDFDVTN